MMLMIHTHTHIYIELIYGYIHNITKKVGPNQMTRGLALMIEAVECDLPFLCCSLSKNNAI